MKIGKPNDFAYAIDQAMLTLEKCEAGMGSLTLPGDLTVSPTEFRMVLIFEGRANMVENGKMFFYQFPYPSNRIEAAFEQYRHISYNRFCLLVSFISLLPLPKPPSVLLIPICKNLSVFLPGKTSVSIRRNPHFTRQPRQQV